MDIGLGLVAIGAGIAVLTGTCTGIGEGMVGAKAVEAVGRNPESAKAVQKMMIMGDAIAETCAIYGLLIALILIFLFPLLWR